jgi:long-chain fatty acid transport protein
MRRALRSSTSFGVALAAMAALFGVDARTASANPPDTFGFGSRGAAMGGAISADVSDFSANYYNPAGLARAHGLELSIGYFRADHMLRTNGNDNHVDPVKGLVGGLVAPGTIFKIPFAFGLGLHLPDDRISRVRALPQEQPRWELYDNRNQRLYLATNVAVSPWPWLQLGGGLSFMSSTEGSLDISGNANITNVSASSLRHEVSADLTAVRYPQLGARVALSKRVALALVYRGEFQLALDLKAKLHGEIQQGLTTALYELTTNSVNAFLPKQVVLGGSWLVTDDLRVGFDATWVNWSAYIAPVASIDVNLNIPLPPGGLGSLTLPTTPAPTRVVPIVMHDRVVPHLGVEWRAIARPKWEAFVRGGYEYAKSPIAPQTGVTNYIDRDRHSVSAGLGGRLLAPLRELPGDVRLDVHAQLSELTTATTTKSDPSNTIGDYTAGGHIWNVGATLTVGF